MPGIGSAPKSDLDLASSASEQVLEVLRSKRKNIQQEQSYAISDTIYASTLQMLVSTFISLIKISFIKSYS